MPRKPVPDILEEIALLLEVKGENPFKSRAYANAARALASVENLDEVIRTKGLTGIKGIGKAIAANIDEYHRTGTMAYLDELHTQVPPSLLELLAVPHLGPKKVGVLHEKLGIATLGELEYACRENRLISLFGFGEATQAKILRGIEFIKMHKGRFLFADVLPRAEELGEYLLRAPGAADVDICGSLRRRNEIVGDIDVLVASGDRQRITALFLAMPGVEEVVASGDTKTTCRLSSGIEADLRVVAPDAFPCARLYFTGSKDHNVRLRGIAKRKGLRLNEYGVFEGEQRISAGDEADVYRILGLSFIEPELREDMGEVEAAGRGDLPELVRPEDIAGVFHVHTDFSDGTDPLERMVEEAKRLGFRYLGVSDHSRSAYYAGGLARDDILRQWEIIDRLNGRGDGFRIFKGIESDILQDGSLDYEEEILEGFDFVIASVHSGFTMKGPEMEERIVRALENPYTTMLGHPTGRLLLSREGYAVDMLRIVDAAGRTGTIIELNASPYRLDIDWRYLKHAKERGVLISINPDAHAAAGLAEYRYGVWVARKGWQERANVLNTRGVNDIKDVLQRVRNEKRNGLHT